jgi:hypothetical protein
MLGVDELLVVGVNEEGGGQLGVDGGRSIEREGTRANFVRVGIRVRIIEEFHLRREVVTLEKRDRILVRV